MTLYSTKLPQPAALVEETQKGLLEELTKFMEEGAKIRFTSNKWLKAHGSEVYVRTTKFSPPMGLQFDLATIHWREKVRGHGILKAVLDHVEKEGKRLGYWAIYVENVFPRLKNLIDHLNRRGYQKTNSDVLLPCFRLFLQAA